MMSLLKYEIRKVGKNFLWSGIMLTISAGVFMIMAYTSEQRFNWDSPALPQVLSMISIVALGVLATIASVAPFIASAVLFNQDLNEPLAIFEAHIPHPGWKRLLAKYASYFGFILAGIAISTLLIYLFFRMVRNAAPIEIQFDFDRITTSLVQEKKISPELIGVMFGSALSLTGGTLFFNFFSTLHSVLRHKLKGALPLTIILAAVAGTGGSWLYDRLLDSNYGLLINNTWGIDFGLIFQGILLIGGFLSISWMLDHKTELK